MWHGKTLMFARRGSRMQNVIAGVSEGVSKLFSDGGELVGGGVGVI